MANAVEITFSLSIPLSYPAAQDHMLLNRGRIFNERDEPFALFERRPLSHPQVRALRDQIRAEYSDFFHELSIMSRRAGGKFTDKHNQFVFLREPDREPIANLDGGATIATLYHAFIAFGGTAAAAAFIKAGKEIFIKWLDGGSYRSATITMDGVKIELKGGAKLDGILEDLVNESRQRSTDQVTQKARNKRSVAQQEDHHPATTEKAGNDAAASKAQRKSSARREEDTETAEIGKATGKRREKRSAAQQSDRTHQATQKAGTDRAKSKVRGKSSD
jgi:hypothetical protein